MSDPIEEFNAYRTRMNEKLLSNDNLVIKRFFNLDTNTYTEGVLDVRTKEMMGLVASAVLRCDDCIKYHLEKCHAAGVTRDEMLEVMQVALIVGGSITIPHMRRAYEFWVALENRSEK